ncbi:MAG: DUF3626 domain-containing protein [Sandaracinus sp.]|nr:DUF3626 domain-containing protein [Myxococcales bacterium]MCB9617220.1 DUF3626 domain-containing protein [Sandaracinus sp.]MCB9618468.1 DUF3626 domain-containing protein [Sandaracinus sp.]
MKLDESQTRALRSVAARSRGEAIDAAWRVTLSFHPDRLHEGEPILAALARDGVYRSQFETRTSNGGLTAFEGGDRWRWESRIFEGAYDEAPPESRPKYGALDFRGTGFGASPRFGSSFLRLRAEVAERTTFCFPDSVFEPEDFGVASAMGLVELARATTLDLLDDYVEAQVHGALRLAHDVEALVLDPCFSGTEVEALARRLPCAVEWHRGFRLPQAAIEGVAAYRGPEVAALLKTLARDGVVTAREIGEAARNGHDPQLVKKAWHGVARFGR